MDKNKVSDREHLKNIIQEWNANRLDLFEISEPNEVRVTDGSADSCFISDRLMT